MGAEPRAVDVRALRAEDAQGWLALRCRLWPDGTRDEHAREVEEFLAGRSPLAEPAVLVAVDADGSAVGFAELSIRACAEGCETSRVAYLEGWFVDAGHRGRGVGRALLEAAEAWGRERGCQEFASDAEPDNLTSKAAHEALGFEDVGLVRCFRKRIEPPAPGRR